MHLLDVNVLVALAWDDHEHFDVAHQWFSTRGQQGFATCHFTQSGFLRLSLNSAVVHRQIKSAEALAKLKTLTSQSPHSFWGDGPVEVDAPIWTTVIGHNQVSDTNLFLIARRNGGKLVTFDRGIRNRVTAEERSWIEIVA